MAKALLLLTLLVTAMAGAPVVAAILVHRDARLVGFIRRRTRMIWCLVALGWTSLTLVHFSSSGSHATLQGWGYLVCAVAAGGVAVFHRPAYTRTGESSSDCNAA